MIYNAIDFQSITTSHRECTQNTYTVRPTLSLKSGTIGQQNVNFQLYFNILCRYFMVKLIWYISLQNNCYNFKNSKSEKLTYNSHIESFSSTIITCNVSVYRLLKWNHCGWVVWCKHRATVNPDVVCCPMHNEVLLSSTVCSAIFDLCNARWGGFL